MQILVAVNTNPHSIHAIDQVARLAANTLAKVTILGIGNKGASNRQPHGCLPAEPDSTDPLHQALHQYHDQYLSHSVHPADDPLELQMAAPRLYVRFGRAYQEIMSESREQDSDLIVLGGDDSNGCAWAQNRNTPQQIAGGADCSVYIAKRAESVDRVVCCLGHEPISQQSLEMVSQFVTLYSARLQLVGLLKRGELKSDIEKKLGRLITYYSAKQIEPWIEVVDTRLFDDFVAYETQYALMALWMGKEALLRKIFSKVKMNRLVKTSESSVLVLR